MNMGLAKLEYSGQITLNGVGNQQTICQHGVYSIMLPLDTGEQAKMTGICVDNITVPFPYYPLKRVDEDFRTEVAKKDKRLLSNLPRLPNRVGGPVDIMLGKQYLKYFWKEVQKLDSGLTSGHLSLSMGHAVTILRYQSKHMLIIFL